MHTLSVRNKLIDDYLSSSAIFVPLCAIFCGILYMQVLAFFTSDRKQGSNSSRLMIKIFVVSITLLNTIKLGFHIWGLYYTTITCWGDFICITQRKEYLAGALVLSGWGLAIVQSYYADRLARVYNQPMIRYVLGVIILAVVGFSLSATVQLLKLPTLLSISPLEPSTTILFSLALFLNVNICGAMCYKFKTSRTGFEVTDFLLKDAFMLAVTSGLIFTMLTAITFILYKTLSNTTFYTIPLFLLPPIEGICAMTIVNSADRVHHKLNDIVYVQDNVTKQSNGYQISSDAK